LVVSDERAVLGIVHGVGQVTDQHAVHAPLGHLADGERAVEYAHVGVHAHDQQVVDGAAAQKAVNFGAVVGDHVFGRDGDAGDLAGPGFVEFVGSVAAAIRVVDGQRRIG